jgi:surface carbohydrate biosynthesis protein
MTLGALFRRLDFAALRKNPIVIVYSSDYWLRTLVLRDLPATTLEMYPERLHLNPGIVLRLVFRLRFLRWPNLRSAGFSRNLLHQCHVLYALACIDQVNPKVVITSIDNSGIFQRLSRTDRSDRAYFAVQNGARTLFCVRDSLASTSTPVISMTDFFCFGQRDVDLFTRHGHSVDRYRPVGSLIGSYYRAALAQPLAKPRFDLCLISQWHRHQFAEGPIPPFTARVSAAIRALNGFLRRLLDETPLSLVVCLRNDNDSDELAFFRQELGERAQLNSGNAREFSTYRTAEQSALAVAVNSTTLSELFSWGQKVLWCNIPEDDHYEMPEAGISYFCGQDYEAFKERVLSLLAMPQGKYEESTRERARYINNYDPSCPAHDAIRAAVLQALVVSR